MDMKEIFLVGGPEDGKVLFLNTKRSSLVMPSVKRITYKQFKNTKYYIYDTDKVKTYQTFIDDKDRKMLSEISDKEEFAMTMLEKELDYLGVSKYKILSKKVRHAHEEESQQGDIYRFYIYIYEGAERVPE